jgi:hypothetical protein
MTPWILALALAYLLFFLARRASPSLDQACNRLLSNLSPAPSTILEERAWAWGGFLFLLASFATLECLQPYYFTQDDVLVTELPGMLFGCRQAWAGLFPDFNPYTFMGTPLAAYGGASLTYPPTYLAYAVARYLLRDEYALMEVFALLHLAVGYWITRHLGRRLGMGPEVATLASLTFVLSGSILIMGRSWHMTLPIVVWVPLLLLSALNLKEGPAGWRWMLGTGIVIGVYYQVGFSQVWAFAMLFWGLAILWFAVWEEIPFRRLLWTVPAFLFGFALALPVLWTQFAATRDMARASGYGNGVVWGIPSFFVPYPLQARHPNLWGSTDLPFMGHLYYFGTLFMVLWLTALLALLTARPRRSVWAGATWVVLGGAALWMSLGNQGGLWKLFSFIPVLKQINNHPFRLLPFFVLLAVLAGGQTLERLLARIRRRRFCAGVVAALGLSLLAYHVAMARPAFYSYGFEPYPALPPKMAKLLKEGGQSGEIPAGRILPIAPARSIAPDFPLALNLSLPLVYGVASVAGYDPLTEARPPIRFARALMAKYPASALKAYGVRWVIVHRTARSQAFSENRFLRGMEGVPLSGFLLNQLQALGAERVMKRPEVEIWALKNSDPMAFPAEDSRHPLPITLQGTGVDVDVGSLPMGGTIVVNYLWYPNARAFLGGCEVRCASDRWGRVTVEVPPGSQKVELVLGARWGRGLSNAGLVLVLSLLLAAWLARRIPSAGGGATP